MDATQLRGRARPRNTLKEICIKKCGFRFSWRKMDATAAQDTAGWRQVVSIRDVKNGFSTTGSHFVDTGNQLWLPG